MFRANPFFSSKIYLFIFQSFLLAVLYFVSGEISFALAVSHHIVTLVVFAAEGFALAAAILFGFRIISGVFFGQLILALYNGLALELAIGISIVNSLEAVLGILLFHKLQLDKSLSKIKDISGLFALIFLVLQPFSASFGILILWLGEVLDASELKMAWFSWWFGNALGQVIVTPMLLGLCHLKNFSRQKLIESFFSLILVIPFSLIALSQSRLSSMAIAFTIATPLLILLAIRLGLSVVTLATFIFSIVALFYTQHQQGVFFHDNEILLLDLNIFLLGITLCGQFVATLFHEHKEMEIALRSTEQRFIDIVNTTDGIVWEFDADNGVFTFVSSQAERLLGYPISNWYQTDFCNLHVHPDDKDLVFNFCSSCVNTEKTYDLEYRFITKKGDIVWFRNIVSVVKKDKQERRLRGVMIDITEKKHTEAALLAAERRFRSTFEYAPLGVVNISLEGHFLVANQNFCQLLGYTKQQILTITIQDIIHPDNQHESLKIINRLLTREIKEFTTESLYLRKDGSSFWGSMSANLLLNDDNADYLIATLQDITERKQNEERIKLCQAYGGIGLWEADLTTSKQTWSEEAHSLFGFPKLNTPTWDDFLKIIHPEDRPRVIDATTAHIEHHKEYDVEYRIVSIDGSIRWIRSAGRAERDKHGKVVYFRGIGQDITKRKQIEQELRDSETKFRAIINASPVPMALNDGLQHITLLNPAFEKNFGYNLKDITTLEEWWFKAYPDGNYRNNVINTWKKHLKRATENKADFETMELNIRCKNGKDRTVIIHAAPIEKSFKGEYLVVLYDITERKKMEKELHRSNADLEQFAYAVSHDMRQPLRMVTSYLSLLDRSLTTELSEEARQFLYFAKDGAKRMDSMILALLDFSRVGRKTATMTLIDSDKALNEALTFLTPEIEKTKAIITITGDWVKIFASHDEIVRLLQNLIGNALKYQQQEITPEISINANVTHNMFEVSVKDNGIGVEPKQHDRLFKVFSRLHSHSEIEGTGVGLALCRRIIEHHNGDIWLESDGENKGCVFKFKIPILAQSN